MRRERAGGRERVATSRRAWWEWAGRGAVLLLLISMSSRTAAAENAARYSIVGGEVRSLEPRQTVAYSARLGARAAVGDRVETGGDGSAQLLFGDATLVSVAAGTGVVVTGHGAGTGAAGPTLELSRGLLRVFVSRLANERLVVTLPEAGMSVGIAAAEATIEVDADGAVRVSVLGGTGPVRWRRGSSSWRRVAAGEQIEVTPRDGKALAEPIPLSAAAADDLLTRTRPSPTMPQQRPRARRREDYGPGSG